MIKRNLDLIVIFVLLFVWFYSIFGEIKEFYYQCETDYQCEWIHAFNEYEKE